MAQTVPPSLVNQSPKIRVLILAKLEWPEMAKNRGEPWKMTHSPVNFFVLELQFSSTGHITSVPGATAFPFRPPKKIPFQSYESFSRAHPGFWPFWACVTSLVQVPLILDPGQQNLVGLSGPSKNDPQ